MKNLVSITLVLIFKTFLVIGQKPCDCFERLGHLADYHFSIGNLDSAVFFYNKGLNKLAIKHKFLPSDVLYRYATYLAHKNVDSSIYFLDLAFTKGYNKEYLKYEPAFKNIRDDVRLKRIVEKEYTIPTHFNLEYYSQLNSIYSIDQSIRSNLKSFIDRNNWNQIDSLNHIKLMELIDKYGYPNFEDHGFEFDAIFTMFMHQSLLSDSIFLNIRNVINESRKTALLSKFHIAMLHDRRNDFKFGKNQTYGTWFFMGKGKPIDDIQNADKRRFEYNMINLQTMFEIFEMQLPEGYKKMRYPKNYFCNQ